MWVPSVALFQHAGPASSGLRKPTCVETGHAPSRFDQPPSFDPVGIESHNSKLPPNKQANSQQHHNTTRDHQNLRNHAFLSSGDIVSTTYRGLSNSVILVTRR